MGDGGEDLRDNEVVVEDAADSCRVGRGAAAAAGEATTFARVSCKFVIGGVRFLGRITTGG